MKLFLLIIIYQIPKYNIILILCVLIILPFVSTYFSKNSVSFLENGHCLYINLDESKSRKKRVEQEIQKIGLSYTRINAYKHNYGIIGCLLSHHQALKQPAQLKIINGF